MTAQLLTLQQTINKYTLVRRHHYIPGTNIHEDDSSHSLSVALICWYYLGMFKTVNLSVEKVLQYALIHDLPEVYAGDVMTYASTAALKQKEHDEARAIKRLKQELAFIPDLATMLGAYQNHGDTEAAFVWTCDKIQAYIQGQADGWRPHIEAGITDEMFITKLNDQLKRVPPFMKDEFQRLSAEWTTSFLQRFTHPKNDTSS